MDILYATINGKGLLISKDRSWRLVMIIGYAGIGFVIGAAGTLIYEWFWCERQRKKVCHMKKCTYASGGK